MCIIHEIADVPAQFVLALFAWAERNQNADVEFSVSRHFNTCSSIRNLSTLSPCFRFSKEYQRLSNLCTMCYTENNKKIEWESIGLHTFSRQIHSERSEFWYPYGLKIPTQMQYSAYFMVFIIVIHWSLAQKCNIRNGVITCNNI